MVQTRSRRRRWHAAALLGIVVTVVAACANSTSSSGTSASGTSTSGSSKSPIVIGVVASQTGTMSAYDLPPTQGEELAVQDINAKGGVLGRPLKLDIFDQKSVVSRGTAGALQVISGGAAAVIVACDYDFGAPAAIVANNDHIPALSTCAGSPLFGPTGIGQYAYTMVATTNYEGSALGEFAYNQKHWRTMYVITDTTIDYTKQIAQYTAEKFRQLGGKIVGTDTMSSANTNIQAQITRLKAVKPAPDVVLLSSFNPDLASAVKQIRDAGINLPLLGHSGWDGTYWLKGIPGFSNAWHSGAGYLSGNVIPAQYKVTQEFEKKFNSAPINSYFLTGYADIQAVASAITRAHSTNGVKVNGALENSTNVPTVMGPLTFTPQIHYPTDFPLIIDKFANGQQKFVMKLTPTNVIPPPA